LSAALFLLCGVERSAALRLADRLINAVNLKFAAPSDDVSRVLDCFERFNAGDELDVLLGDNGSGDGHNRQRANCYVKGLRTCAFHDINNGQFEWAKRLEANAHVVQDELQRFLTGGSDQSSSKWLGPRFVQKDNGHYGTEWKTLGLQDRGVWDGENVDAFPQTVALLGDCQVPSCEAFFARQGPRSGIQPHSDLNNFILTAHLAVDVPEGQCWIRVGDDKHYWKNGKVCCFDTSIYHSTFNEADRDRFVLLIRFWHPDLTATEVRAFSFIFDFLDHANLGDAALNAFEAEHVYGLVSSTAGGGRRSATAEEEATLFVGGDDGRGGGGSGMPLSRQQRREQERKLAKAQKKGGGGGGFHRGA